MMRLNVISLSAFRRTCRSFRIQVLRAVSVIMLAALPLFLLWPMGFRSPMESLARYVGVAIYRFDSDDMPRCEQFARHTHALPPDGAVACQTPAGQLMV